MISIVLCEYKIGFHYVKEHRFYSVDLRNIYFKEDDRFRKRECNLKLISSTLNRFELNYACHYGRFMVCISP